MPRTAVFLDNTVLCNFAAVHRRDLLESVLRGRGRWTEAVAHEAATSAGHLPDLGSLPSEGWLGAPIAIDAPAQVRLVQQIRRAVFGGLPERPLQHLGEAETYVLLHERTEFRHACWVTDDREAMNFARRQGILSRETLDLVMDLVAEGDLTAQLGFDLMVAMDEAGRTPRMPVRPGDLLA